MGKRQASTANCCGVYKITNRKNGKIYIGSSLWIRRRWEQHKHLLNRNEHPNRHLQSAWNKYGAENFDYEVVEITTAEGLVEREQWWIDHLKACDPKIGYNIHPHANFSGPFTRSDETRRKISQALTGRKQSEETIRKRTEALRGKKRSPELVERIARAIRISWKLRSRTHSEIQREAHLAGVGANWVIITPEGNELRTKNLSRFCRDHNISSSQRTKGCRPHKRAYHGWRFLRDRSETKQ